MIFQAPISQPPRAGMVWDSGRGVWVRADHARGLGATYEQTCAAPMNWFEKLTLAPYCSIAWGETAYGDLTGRPLNYPAPPSPPPPDIKLVVGAASASSPGAIYAGDDPTTGAPVYAIPQTAGENMQVFRDSVAAFMAAQGDKTPPPDPCAGISGWFNSSCPSFTTQLLIGGAIVAGLLLLPGGRR